MKYHVRALAILKANVCITLTLGKPTTADSTQSKLASKATTRSERGLIIVSTSKLGRLKENLLVWGLSRVYATKRAVTGIADMANPRGSHSDIATMAHIAVKVVPNMVSDNRDKTDIRGSI